MKIKLGTLRKLIKEALDEMAPTDERDQIASIYSDVYKEKYGIRPRHLHWDEYSTEELSAMLEKLYDERGYDDEDYLPVKQEFPDMEGTVDPSEPPDPFETLPKAVGMKRDPMGREKRSDLGDKVAPYHDKLARSHNLRLARGR